MLSSLIRSPESEAFRDSVRQLLNAHAAPERTRAVLNGDTTASPWPALLSQARAVHLAVPEELGGDGAGLPELVDLAEEAGYHVAVAPLTSTWWASRLLVHAGATVEIAELLSSGQPWAAISADVPLAWAPGTGATLGVDGLLTMRPTLVPTPTDTFALAVAATGPDGPVLCLTRTATEGVRVQPVELLDRTQGAVRVTITAARCTVLARGDDAVEAVGRATAEAAVCVAAEQIGVAQRALDMSVGHVKTREQFGQPVGKFQAVKHLAADCLARIEAARSLVLVAAHANRTDLSRLAASALATADDAAIHVTSTAIQLHGGIGYTWEHDAHLLLKRARANATWWGSPTALRRWLMDQAGESA